MHARYKNSLFSPLLTDRPLRRISSYDSHTCFIFTPRKLLTGIFLILILVSINVQFFYISVLVLRRIIHPYLVNNILFLTQ